MKSGRIKVKCHYICLFAANYSYNNTTGHMLLNCNAGWIQNCAFEPRPPYLWCSATADLETQMHKSKIQIEGFTHHRNLL